ncbi:MAG: DUF2239 family protein [Geminicoccaceae bacterium]
MDEVQTVTAFAGTRRIAAGALAQVAVTVKQLLDRGEGEAILVFDDDSGKVVEVDFRGSTDDVRHRFARLEPPAARGPGRPKLGVVAREVTLLPRHWDWLASQPGGASVALRKLVEEARRAHAGRDRARRAQEAAYCFMSAMAGDLPGFEEASRALFAGDTARLAALTATWPVDIRDHVATWAAAAFGAADQAVNA